MLTRSQIIYGNPVETCRPYSCYYTSQLFYWIHRIITDRRLNENHFNQKSRTFLCKTHTIICVFYYFLKIMVDILTFIRISA